jgi:hypothetical protein
VRVSPAGKEPLVADQVYGGVPPDAVQAAEYATPSWVGPAAGVHETVRGGVGGTFAMVNDTGADALPPGLTTVMLAAPGVASRLAGTETTTFVALARKESPGRFVLFQWTLEPDRISTAPPPGDTKLVPLIVNWKLGPPAVAELWLRLVITGTTGETAKVAMLELGPSG